MQRRACAFCTFLAVLAVAGLLAATHASGQPSLQTSPASAAQGALVPVNVRVIDRAGKPVTDLKQTDFTITEDGVPQQIRHFSLQTLTPETPQPGARPVVRTGISLAPQNHRIFLIALGLGRLDDTSRAITALVQLVRTRLLPQDQVAVFAYDRALPFTTDHEKVAQVLERFRRVHPDIDYEIELQLGPTGMAALYGRKVIPSRLQTKIDGRADAGGEGARRVRAGSILRPVTRRLHVRQRPDAAGPGEPERADGVPAPLRRREARAVRQREGDDPAGRGARRDARWSRQ
jgi:hypothetical protein